MAFTTPDPLEQDMSVLVEDMTADQLVNYLREYQEQLNDVRIAISGYPETARMKWLIETYGQPDAGRIIKWTYWCHRGKWTGRDGKQEFIKPMRFNAKMKWWVDEMHSEMQRELTRAERKAAKKNYEGFATAETM